VQETLIKLYVWWPRRYSVDNLHAYVKTMLVRIFVDGRRRGWWKVALTNRTPDRPGPAEPKDCTIHRLPTGGIGKALVSAGDPSGHYLAGRAYPPGSDPRTVVCKDGQLQGDTAPGEDADGVTALCRAASRSARTAAAGPPGTQTIS
jgi:hypothetical protein